MTSHERAASMSRDEIAALIDENAALAARTDDLQPQLDWLKRQLFGEKSERRFDLDTSRQLSLGEGIVEKPKAAPPIPEPIRVPEHARRKQRSEGDVLPEGLRFDDSVPMTIIELVDAETDGIDPADLALIECKRTYRVAQRPGAFEIVCYERKALKHRKTGQIFCAPAPDNVLEKSHADVSLLAGMLVDKLHYHLPLYRQHQRLADAGITVSRSSLTNWTQRAIDLLTPIHDAQLASILSGQTLAMDETPIKAGRKGKGQTKGQMKRGYFWPVYGDRDEVAFLFAPTRARAMVDKTLEGFAGVLLTDGYDPYARYAERTHDVVHAQCWAHTRRKFIEAASADPKLAQSAVAHIGLLYEHETWIRERGLTGKEKLAARAERCLPLVKQFFEWLDHLVNEKALLPSNPLLGAIEYARSRRAGLEVFLDYPDVPMDTNHLEREIRPIAVGRKNSYDHLSTADRFCNDLMIARSSSSALLRALELGAGLFRRSIRLLFGGWIPHDDLRRTGFLNLAAVVRTQNS